MGRLTRRQMLVGYPPALAMASATTVWADERTVVADATNDSMLESDQTGELVIKLWEKPYEVHSENDPTANVEAINAAIGRVTRTSVGRTDRNERGLPLFPRGEMTPATILFPRGRILINAPIKWRTGAELRGFAPSPAAWWHGSELFLVDGSNCNMIETVPEKDDWIHWARLTNLRLDGNKRGQTPGSGSCIYVHRSGECTVIDRVQAKNGANYNIHFGGPGEHAPIMVRDCSTFHGHNGQYLIEGGGRASILSPSGDQVADNPDKPFFHLRSNGSGCIHVSSPKLEGPQRLLDVDIPPDDFDRAQPSISVYDGGANGLAHGGIQLSEFIRILGGHPAILLSQTSAYGYSNLLTDYMRGKSIPLLGAGADQTQGLFTYRVRVRHYDLNGDPI